MNLGYAMKISAIVVAGLLAGALGTVPAQAQAAPAPALSHFYPQQPALPQQPPPGPSADPRAEVQELLRQVSDLDDNWDRLSPPQRNQRIAGLQQQVTKVQNDINALPADQRPEVQGMLSVAVLRLANILRKEQTPPTSPCIFPACLPGL